MSAIDTILEALTKYNGGKPVTVQTVRDPSGRNCWKIECAGWTLYSPKHLFSKLHALKTMLRLLKQYGAKK